MIVGVWKINPLFSGCILTLQYWKQGRRDPSGAAKTLIAIAERILKVLREAVTL